MPELPEVETVRQGLARLLPRKVIAGVESSSPRSFPNAQTDVDRFLVGASIVSVRRRAKILIIDLDSGYSLVIHLKMTGQLVFWGKERFGAGHPNDSLVGDLPDKSTRVTITFRDGSRLFFNDQRKFGWVRLLPTVELDNLEFISKLGPEPLEPEFTNKVFRERLKRRSKSSIKAVLLDQTVLAGVGNIYADESLWAAKIHPKVLTGDISVNKLDLLHTELLAVLNLSLAKGGSSSRNYVNAEGKKGSYMDFARVYRREGQPCKRCGKDLVKIRVAGRGTHICLACQKEPK